MPAASTKLSWVLFGLLTALNISVFIWPEIGHALAFEREAIKQGQLWRLLTGHFVHITPLHALANLTLLGLLLSWPSPISQLQRWWVLLCAAGIISIALFFFWPEITWYRGLSGSLYALVWVTFWPLRSERIYQLVLLLTGLYALFPVSEVLWSFMVIHQAHWLGFLVGTCFIITQQTIKYVQKK